VLAVVADPHVAEGRGTWKVTHRSRERLGTAVGVAAGTDVDATLVAGDLTGDGRRSSFGTVDGLLTGLDAPVVVPGNHDVPKRFDDHDGLPVGRFADRYAPPGGYPAAVDVGPLTILAVDTATAADGRLGGTWGGRVGEDQRAWLRERARAADIPVVLSHHNVARLPENPGGKWRQFQLRDADAVRGVLSDVDGGMVVSGHHHVPAVATHGRDTPAGLAPTREVLAPAVCSYPQAMALLDVGPGGTRVTLVPLADREGVREARRHARGGAPLGVGILEAVDRRLGDLPLVDEQE
jgi:3',5'-cyclic AMP phosphodiesterase CpdA